MNIFVAILNEAFAVVVEQSDHNADKALLKTKAKQLVKELKMIGEQLKYQLKKCCTRRRNQNTKAFNRFKK